MKRLFLLLALVGVLGISCSDKEETMSNKPQTPTEQPEDNTGSENDDNQVTNKPNIPNNEIWYTTSDNTKLFPNSIEPRYFGALLVSNTYDNGKGILTFDGDIKVIGDSMFSGYYVYYNGGGDFSHFGYYSELCKSLTSISIPNSVTAIGDYAFSKCNNLTSITLSDNVTTIRNRPFEGCSSLSLVNVNIGDLAKYCTGHYMNRIPGKKHLFANNTEIIELIIPDSVTTIGDSAFSDCSSLTSVTIGDSVTAIGYGAFAGCSSLISVTIPDSVTTIEDNAFAGCSSLTSVTIPDSVTSIGDMAFSACDSLQEFSGKFASEDGYYLVVDSELILFAKSCDAEEYSIPENVVNIATYAFENCQKLKQVAIPESVTNIDEYAFANCSNVALFTFKSTTPPTLGANVFAGIDNLQISIPVEAVEAYLTCDWPYEYRRAIIELADINNIPDSYRLYYTTNDNQKLRRLLSHFNFRPNSAYTKHRA